MVMSKKIKEKCKKIDLVLTDVDGVLTDGGMFYSVSREELKKFNARDGMAVELLRRNGVSTIFLTKDDSKVSKNRAKKLKAKGFGQHAEILCEVVKKGKKFYEVPINYNGRTSEDGKKVKFYHI